VSANSSDKIVKIVFTFKRDRWRVAVLKVREGAKAPVLAFRAKCDTLGDALDAFEDYRNGVVIV
jgi:hypothetical protein